MQALTVVFKHASVREGWGPAWLHLELKPMWFIGQLLEQTKPQKKDFDILRCVTQHIAMQRLYCDWLKHNLQFENEKYQK